MTPLPFPEANAVLAENQPPYLPLPVWIAGDSMGTMVSCWQLTPEEIAEVASTGKLWVSTWTFNQPPHPIALMTDKPVMGTGELPMGHSLFLAPAPGYDGTYKVSRVSNHADETFSEEIVADGLTWDNAAMLCAERRRPCSDVSPDWYVVRRSTDKEYIYEQEA